MTSSKLPNLIDYQDKYSEPGLWGKISKVAQKAGIKVIYLALLFYYVLKSNTVSKKDKSLIYGALGYFILPVDLIPDAIPMVGFSDDLAALIFAMVKVSKGITSAVKDRANAKLHEWFGNYNENEIIIDPEDYDIRPDDQQD